MAGDATDTHDGSALQRLREDDALGQLRRRDGLMAMLGSEDGALKLDWVEGVARLLDDQAQLEEVEAEARALWQQGIRHIIWAGMGGSVITIRVLAQLGFCDGHQGERMAIYPLDSTDPAALNTIVEQIARAKEVEIPAVISASWLHTFLADVMMVGVAMGMTSEEPITHLAWFSELLEQAQLSPAQHILVMTLPGSYLDRFAQEHQAPSRPLQLDRGTGTGGRMSAPTTRVFLLPAALYLTRTIGAPGSLRALLQRAWDEHDLARATTNPEQHLFVQLAAALADVSRNGACRLMLDLPPFWRSLRLWIEQLMEESLGKGGKGIVVFDAQELNHQAPAFHRAATLSVRVTGEADGATSAGPFPGFMLQQPSLAQSDPTAQLAALVTSFLGWQLTMALYGYVQHIQFAGQPAVENYKARARALRTMDDPLQTVRDWSATIYHDSLIVIAPRRMARGWTPAELLARELRQALSNKKTPLEYLDCTVNGEIPAGLRQMLAEQLSTIGNGLLGVPFKLRQAPADYHSTEQSEMDGPPALVSLRLLWREQEASRLGNYSAAFLHAQAVSTWQAMEAQGRSCFLLIIDGPAKRSIQPLRTFFDDVAHQLQGTSEA